MRSQKLSQPSSVLIFCFSTISRLLSRLSSYQSGLRLSRNWNGILLCSSPCSWLADKHTQGSRLHHFRFCAGIHYQLVINLHFFRSSLSHNGILIYFSFLSSVHKSFFLRCNVRTAFIALQLLFSSASRFERISWIFTKRKRLRLPIDRKFRCYLIRCPKFFAVPARNSAVYEAISCLANNLNCRHPLCIVKFTFVFAKTHKAFDCTRYQVNMSH